MTKKKKYKMKDFGEFFPREEYDGVMDMIEWKKKRISRRKPPKDFEGW